MTELLLSKRTSVRDLEMQETKKPTIFIVEDDKDLQTIYKRVFENNFYIQAESFNGLEAIEKYKTLNSPDIISLRRRTTMIKN